MVNPTVAVPTVAVPTVVHPEVAQGVVVQGLVVVQTVAQSQGRWRICPDLFFFVAVVATVVVATLAVANDPVAVVNDRGRH